MDNIIKLASESFVVKREHPEFKSGDTVTVTVRIHEEGKNQERLQKFRGVIIQRRGAGLTQTFTIRKMSGSVGVERIFPINCPTIQSIEVNKIGVVRRARIFYYRELKGKKARIKEKQYVR